MKTKAGPILALAGFAAILEYNWVVMRVGLNGTPRAETTFRGP